MTSNSDLNKAWSVIRVFVEDKFAFGAIKQISGLAGIDITKFSHLVQEKGNTKPELMSALDDEIKHLSTDEKSNVLANFAEIIEEKRPIKTGDFFDSFKRLGWEFTEGKLIPINLFDISELEVLPESAGKDLIKAASRLRAGDLDAALTSACAAVDSADIEIYQENQITRQANDGFQSCYGTALNAKGTLVNFRQELIELGWQERDANRLVDNLKGSLNQGANVMQTLRSNMSDVHGSKKVFEPLVFDSIKWASLILRMLK